MSLSKATERRLWRDLLERGTARKRLIWKNSFGPQGALAIWLPIALLIAILVFRFVCSSNT